MSKKQVEKQGTRTGDTRKVDSRRENHGPGVGKTNNPNGRPPRELCFTNILRDELTKRKRFRRPDGSLMEASELELIALKVVRELRSGLTIDNKLLAIVLDRIEGKPKEMVDINATVQAASGIDPRDVLLQRLSRILDSAEQRTKEDDDDDQD